MKQSGYTNHELRPEVVRGAEQHDSSANTAHDDEGVNYMQYEIEGGSGPRSGAESNVSDKVSPMDWNKGTTD